MIFNTVKIKDVKVRIGQLVKNQRKQHNLSQKELGKLLNCSRITIQNVESGKNFTIDTLFKILQHFELLAPLNDEITRYMNDNENIESLY